MILALIRFAIALLCVNIAIAFSWGWFAYLVLGLLTAFQFAVLIVSYTYDN